MQRKINLKEKFLLRVEETRSDKNADGMQQFYLTPENSDNPNAWFFKAQPFRSTVLFILEQHQLKVVGGVKIDEIVLINDAIMTIPYLTCLGLEIYMKGYLVFKGLRGKEVRRYNHKIWEIRKKCYEISGRIEFNNQDLTYLTNQLGSYILEDGGVKYPHKRDPIVPIDSCKLALNLMHHVLKDAIEFKTVLIRQVS